MMSQPNAKLTAKGRLALVKRILEGERQIDVANALGVSRFTACKWVRRCNEGGEAALADKSSRPDVKPAMTQEKKPSGSNNLVEKAIATPRLPPS